MKVEDPTCLAIGAFVVLDSLENKPVLGWVIDILDDSYLVQTVYNSVVCVVRCSSSGLSRPPPELEDFIRFQTSIFLQHRIE